MCRTGVTVLLSCLLVLSVGAAYRDDSEDAEDRLVRKVIEECAESQARLRCFSNKAAVVLERSMNMDVPLFDGLKLVRNGEGVRDVQGRSFSDGFGRFRRALWNFLNTHKLTLDLTQRGASEARRKKGQNQDTSVEHNYFYIQHGDEHDDKSDEHDDGDKGGGYSKGGGGNRRKGGLFKGGMGKGGKGGGGGGEGGGGHGGGGGGGFGFGGYKGLKRERKYIQYAFMVLLGIFGLTGPLFMKTLAVIAAKALIASKMALIIVGSVMLKKLFSKDHSHPSVKVHTVIADHEDLDRVYNYDQIFPYSAHGGYAKPV